MLFRRLVKINTSVDFKRLRSHLLVGAGDAEEFLGNDVLNGAVVSQKFHSQRHVVAVDRDAQRVHVLGTMGSHDAAVHFVDHTTDGGRINSWCQP